MQPCKSWITWNVSFDLPGQAERLVVITLSDELSDLRQGLFSHPANMGCGLRGKILRDWI